MLLCMNCLEIYESIGGNLLDGSACPKRECLGVVADIDELLLPSIMLLNEKGYFTEFCCSGHFHIGTEVSAYIAFSEFIEQADLPVLPRGFSFDPNVEDYVCIRRKIYAGDRFDLHREVVEASLDVLEWAETLPEYLDT